MLDPLNDQLPQRLACRLRGQLPGRRSHRKLASELAYGRHAGPPLWDARPAAVLVCLYPSEGRWHIPLTLRPPHMVQHARQVSFPGGMLEPGETLEACALREYEEELGADSRDLFLLGRLTPLYVFASNFLVTPCVAATANTPRWRPNPDEVERMLQLSLDVLVQPSCRGGHVLHRGGYDFATRHLLCGDDRIWGATAMMLAEVADVISEARGSTPLP